MTNATFICFYELFRRWLRLGLLFHRVFMQVLLAHDDDEGRPVPREALCRIVPSLESEEPQGL